MKKFNEKAYRRYIAKFTREQLVEALIREVKGRYVMTRMASDLSGKLADIQDVLEKDVPSLDIATI